MKSNLPQRGEVPVEHRWDLSKLFPDDAAWEISLKEYQARSPAIESYRGRLGDGAETVRELLDLIHDIGLLEERLGYYAQLRACEDLGNSEAQGRLARYMNIATAWAARSSFVTPEIQAIPDTRMQTWLDGEALAPYRIYLHKMLRYKPHVLSEPEERLLAMQTEFSQTPRQAFNALTDVDLQFGDVDDGEGPRPLTHATYASFMQHADRPVRRQAYLQYIEEFYAHRHTLAALYAGSVQTDVYRARVRHFASAREASLFADDVPVSVYDGLIAAVHEFLPTLHRYYALRRRVLKLAELRLYDTRVPLVPGVRTQYPYEQAVEVVTASLAPLGEEYVETLRKGLRGRWVDRYENQGKRSGAFSAASFTGDPYILMNYKEEVLNDVFTLTHEAGHSMHSWYSARHQPFQHYSYTIFVAEVASTFNERLLARHLMEQTQDAALLTYLINKQVDDMLATLFRQTMFAEFEKETHAMAERNEPLTVDSLTSTYTALLQRYFGPEIPLEAHSAMEGLRVPHFYSAFYVYKYATGMSAALALYDRVINGGPSARTQYLEFLKSGGSQFPLQQLQQAGVDMTSPAPVRVALQQFSQWVDQLTDLL